MQKKNPFRSKTYCEKNLVTAVFGTVPRPAVPGGWLLRRPCGWLLPFVLRPLAVGCCPSFCCPWLLAAALRPAAPGCWLLPFILLPLAAGCCSSVCCPSFCYLSSCCPWRLDTAPRSAAAPSVRLAAASRFAALGGWLLPLSFQVNVEVARYFRHSVDGRSAT